MLRTSYWMPALVPLALAALCSTALCAGLDEIMVKWSPEGTKVILACDSPVPFKHYKLTDLSRIYIECAGLKNNIRGESYPGINRGGVVGISISRFDKADFTRIVIATDGPREYTAVDQGSSIVLTLKTGAASVGFPDWFARKAEAVVFKPLKEEVKPEAAAAPTAKEVEAKKPAMVKSEAGSRLVSMDLEDADLLTVLRALAEYSGRNIVAGKGVTGSVTVSLRDVAWLTALETILKANGLAYIIEEGIIRVATPSEIARIQEEEEKAAPLVDKVYKIEFGDAGEIAAVVNKSLSRRGRLETDARTNSIVVSDIGPTQRSIEKLLAVLDSPTPQVEIAVKVVDMSYGLSNELGLRWTVDGVQSRTFNIDTAEAVIGLPQDWQVHVTTLRDFARIDAQIRFWESEDRLKTVASPRVTAVNNREASILAGTKFTITALDQRGNPITQLYTVGTLLRATPHINSLDEITLDIHAELSSVTEASILAGKPIVTTSEADTRQLVSDGETVVLGGFLNEEESASETGIPVLKDIPLLGRLFKSTAKTTDTREIVFFITPHIIKRFE